MSLRLAVGLVFDHRCVRASIALCASLVASSLNAGPQAIPLIDFDGPNPLAGWAISSDQHDPGVGRWLTSVPGHTGRGAAIEYRFGCTEPASCGGAVTAYWTPSKPVAVKRKGALSLWVRAAAEVRLTLVTRDKDEGLRRYPFEVITLEHLSPAEWRRVVIPLSAKSTGYWDEDHTGKTEGRLSALGIRVESRVPRPIHGSVELDEVSLLESPDQVFELNINAALAERPPDSGQLKPRLGVNVHTWTEEALDQAREAGFSFVRADLLWQRVERNGRYRFMAYQRLLNALRARGMDALWILDYGHPQHGGDPPRNPDDVAAFARYAEAAALAFKGSKSRFEVWNEPDTTRFWAPQPNAREYGALLNAAAAAIHRADSDARVASGGTSGTDLPYLQQLVSSGTSMNWDAFAIHPYRRLAPETFAPELQLARQLFGAQDKFWDTEWGYASYDYFSMILRGDGHSPAGRKRQAVLACREALTIWALGVPVAVWYDLRDDGDDPRNPEHNYGLLDSQGVAKPAMKVLRTLASLADHHSFAGTIRNVTDGAHAMRLDGDRDIVFVAWSDQPDSRITLQVPNQSFISATDLMGAPLKLRQSKDGRLEIALAETDGPVYLTFGRGQIKGRYPHAPGEPVKGDPVKGDPVLARTEEPQELAWH